MYPRIIRGFSFIHIETAGISRKVDPMGGGTAVITAVQRIHCVPKVL
jgi:hypothetical protein